MRKLASMAAALTLLLITVVLAPPVLAQGAASGKAEARAADPRFPPPPKYAVTTDGLGVVVEGDVVINCEAIPPGGEAERLCAQRDSMPTSPSLSSVPRMEPASTTSSKGSEDEARAEEKTAEDKAGTEKKEDELPSSGGAPLLALGIGALVVSGGLLARKILR